MTRRVAPEILAARQAAIDLKCKNGHLREGNTRLVTNKKTKKTYRLCQVCAREAGRRCVESGANARRQRERKARPYVRDPFWDTRTPSGALKRGLPVELEDGRVLPPLDARVAKAPADLSFLLYRLRDGGPARLHLQVA